MQNGFNAPETARIFIRPLPRPHKNPSGLWCIKTILHIMIMEPRWVVTCSGVRVSTSRVQGGLGEQERGRVHLDGGHSCRRLRQGDLCRPENGGSKEGGWPVQTLAQLPILEVSGTESVRQDVSNKSPRLSEPTIQRFSDGLGETKLLTKQSKRTDSAPNTPTSGRVHG